MARYWPRVSDHLRHCLILGYRKQTAIGWYRIIPPGIDRLFSFLFLEWAKNKKRFQTRVTAVSNDLTPCDSYSRLGRCYQHKSQSTVAIRWLRSTPACRDHGVPFNNLSRTIFITVRAYDWRRCRVNKTAQDALVISVNQRQTVARRKNPGVNNKLLY